MEEIKVEEEAELSEEEKKKQKEEEERKRKEEEEMRAEEEELRREEEEMRKEEEKKKQLEKEAEALKQQGNEYYKKKSLDKALEFYNQAVEKCPTKMVFRLNRAAVYSVKKQWEKSIKECEEAIEIGRKNEASFEMIGKAFVRIGNSYAKQGQLEKAIELYNEALTEHRSKLALSSLTRVERLLKKKKAKEFINPEIALKLKDEGNEHFKKGEFFEAIKKYREASKRNPKDTGILNNLGFALMKIREYHEALKALDKSLEIDSEKNVKAWLRKGQCQFYSKEYHKSLETFKQALELFPEDKNLLSAKLKVDIAINTAEYDEERIARAKADPEIQAILRDPSVQQVLKEMNENPKAAQKHFQNENMKRKLEKLIASGILQTKRRK